MTNSKEVWDEMKDDFDLYIVHDYKLSPDGIKYRDKLIEEIEAMHDIVVKFQGSNSRYSQIINDLTMSLEWWIGGYPFDDDHICKQRDMIDNACLLIGKPRNMEELVEMSGLGDEYLELARKQDAELTQ